MCYFINRRVVLHLFLELCVCMSTVLVVHGFELSVRCAKPSRGQLQPNILHCLFGLSMGGLATWHFPTRQIKRERERHIFAQGVADFWLTPVFQSSGLIRAHIYALPDAVIHLLFSVLLREFVAK